MSAAFFRCFGLLGALLLTVLLFAPSAVAQSGDDPVPVVTRTVAIENTRIVQAPGRIIERGTVVLRDGLIHAVGEDVDVPFDAERIAGDSLIVYAGFIDGLSHAGIPQGSSEGEPEEVEDPGSPPRARAGIQPDRAAHDVLDPSAASIKALRDQGFAVAHTVPRGQMLPGTGAVILLAGSDASGMILKDEASLFMQLEGAEGSYPNAVYPSTPMAVIAQMRQLYRDAARRQQLASAYDDNPEGRARPVRDPAHAAFFPLIDGTRPAFFNVETTLDLYRALALHEELGFPLALTGLAQAYQTIETLQAADAPLFLTLDLPDAPDSTAADSAAADTLAVGTAEADAVTTRSDTTKAITQDDPSSYFVRDFRTRSYEDAEDETKNLEARQAIEREKYVSTAARLREAGLRFGFSTKDATPADLRKNLRTMIENGLAEDDALAALTTDAAEQLGLARQLGTVEEGKIGNLVVTENGPYFADSSRVRFVFVDGQKFEIAEATEPPAEGVEPAGTWSYAVETPGGTISGTMTLTGTPGDLSGTITGAGTDEAPLRDVALSGSTLTFSFDAGQFGEIDASLTLDGDVIEGTMTTADGESVPVTGARTSGPER